MTFSTLPTLINDKLYLDVDQVGWAVGSEQVHQPVAFLREQWSQGLGGLDERCWASERRV